MNYLKKLTVAVFAFSLPMSVAFAGSCCSGHGGVTGVCTGGFQQCKDKSMPPTCKCTMPKKAKKANTTTKTTVKETTKGTIKPMTKSSVNKAPVSTSSGKGCCSKHGGVASCNTATGMNKCKDGSDSPTCKCH